jgi:hypothetical protein
MTGKTHDAEMAFFRIHAVSLDFDKHTHGAQVNAFVGVPAMMGSSAQIRVDIHFNAYIC